MTDQRLVCEAEQKIARAARRPVQLGRRLQTRPRSPSLSVGRRSDGNVDKVCFIGKLDRMAGSLAGRLGERRLVVCARASRRRVRLASSETFNYCSARLGPPRRLARPPRRLGRHLTRPAFTPLSDAHNIWYR